ncbi:MAG TPA: ribbon-helix-helix protein, CopG family, partial [bacterium]|nr:ribbon-helix-helix protein, CopG family [bacterium]
RDKGEIKMKESYLDRLDKIQNKKKKLTIYLTSDMAKKLKVYAAREEKTISQVVEDALTSKLQDVK